MTFKYTAIQITSQGFTSVPLKITASNTVSPPPYTLLLSTNSSYPTAEFIGASVPNSGLPGKSLPDYLTPKEENSASQTVLVVTIPDALSNIESNK